MSVNAATKRAIHRRLMPLYIAAFMQNFVLWYTIEKLFMRSIGFDDASIGIAIAAYSAVILVFETPSGILADRWSRKGVLMLASVALIASSLIAGISHTIPIYMLSFLSWGVYYAMYSGTYDSIIYDTLYEEAKDSSMFERYYGRVSAAESLGLVISSLLGGVIASATNLRITYFITIPFIVLSIVALWRFREPTLHKSKIAIPIKHHIQATFIAVLRNKYLVPILAVLLLTTTTMYILFEFSQLWLIALALPTVFFGPANAALLSSLGLGGLAADFFKLRKFSMMIIALAILLISTLGLIFSRNGFITVTSQALIAIVLVGIGVVFNRLLHDSLDSHVRAGAASAVSTLGRIIIIPVAIIFGYLSKNIDIFQAGWTLCILAMLAALFVIITALRNNSTGLDTPLK